LVNRFTHDMTTVSGKLFHTFTILLVKKYFRINGGGYMIHGGA